MGERAGGVVATGSMPHRRAIPRRASTLQLQGPAHHDGGVVAGLAGPVDLGSDRALRAPPDVHPGSAYSGLEAVACADLRLVSRRKPSQHVVHRAMPTATPDHVAVPRSAIMCSAGGTGANIRNIEDSTCPR